MKTRRIGPALALLLAFTALLAAPAQAAAPHRMPLRPIPVRVVVVTTFEIGQDTGDTPGEFQAWVEGLPLTQTLPFANGMRPLRYDPKTQVLGVVSGSGSINAAASTMALGLDPRFDLSHAYWLIAGIAGINPNQGSVGSAAWAGWVVDRDLSHEIDSREIPPDWSTGLAPLSRARPFQAPPPGPGIYSPNAYRLNGALTDWAYQFTQNTPLTDTPALAALRARYPGQPQAQTPPHVMRGDEVSAMNWWVGALMNKGAEDWMAYWTAGQGVMVTSAMEDTGVLRALQFLAQTHRADPARVMVLRTASDYVAPGAGQTAAQLLEAEAGGGGSGALSAYRPALDAAFKVGAPVVRELSGHWDRYKDHPPGVGPGT